MILPPSWKEEEDKPKGYLSERELTVKVLSITPTKTTGIFKVVCEHIGKFHVLNDKFTTNNNDDPPLILIDMDKESNTMTFATPQIWGGMLKGDLFFNTGWNILRE